MNCKTLYRPVGLKELALIKHSGWKRFPPRLAWQPIFYPVIHQAYAEQIAREWNTADAFGDYWGVVTAFDLETSFLSKYPVQNVGNNGHDELWIPAEDLEEFNNQIIGCIRVVNAFSGKGATLPDDNELTAILQKFKS